jgi:hypothetical protein
VRGNPNFVITEDVITAYLDHLECHGLLAKAALHVGGRPSQFRSLRDRSPEFAAAVEDSLQIFKENVEEELRRRAMDGIEKGVYFQGVRRDTEIQYSDSLLTLLVKKVNPDYNEKSKAEVSITGGVLLTASQAPSTEEWMRMNSKSKPQLPASESGDIVDVTENAEPVLVGSDT